MPRAHAATIVILIGLLLAGCATAARFDARPWLDDYRRLRRHLGEAYANLEWEAESGVVDLAELDRRTTGALGSARSAADARAVLVGFVAAFKDPHLRVVEPEPPPPPSAAAAASGAEKECRDRGYHGEDRRARVSWPRVAGFELLGGGPFVHGVVRGVGVLRVPSFVEQDYLATCVAVWRPGLDERELRRLVARRLVEDARAALDRLRSRAVRAVLVDVTGNGGGNDWVNDVTDMFLRGPRPCTTIGILRHPHWERQLARSLHKTDEALGAPGLAPDKRRELETDRVELQRLLGEVRGRCDREPLFRGAKLACSAVVKTAPDCSEERRGAAAGIDVPVLVLVDGLTASASEYLAAALRDTGAARVIGERTMGAGCGMTGGGIPITLPHSGLVVELPDCVRYRQDGTNERAGVTPDLSLGGDWTATILDALPAGP